MPKLPEEKSPFIIKLVEDTLVAVRVNVVVNSTGTRGERLFTFEYPEELVHSKDKKFPIICPSKAMSPGSQMVMS